MFAAAGVGTQFQTSFSRKSSNNENARDGLGSMVEYTVLALTEEQSNKIENSTRTKLFIFRQQFSKLAVWAKMTYNVLSIHASQPTHFLIELN